MIDITVGGPISIDIVDGVYHLDGYPVVFPLVVMSEDCKVTVDNINELQTILTNSVLSNL